MDHPRLRLWAPGPIGAVVLVLIVLPCVLTLPWSLQHYEGKAGDEQLQRDAPQWSQPFGRDALGRSVLWRCLLGGAISLGIGASAALIAVVIGVHWGAMAGLAGGRTDAFMMRVVDVLFGLPYILLVVLIDLGLSPIVESALGKLPADTAAGIGDLLTLLLAIGGLSWLTMARVIRGQVLSLRERPFVEAARACGVSSKGILIHHLLPNLVGPIIVYATLTVPAAILAESTLSFLGIGVQAPLPSWGNLASEGLEELHLLAHHNNTIAWWLIVWPCGLLGLTLMALNFLGDALREKLDPTTRG